MKKKLWSIRFLLLALSLALLLPVFAGCANDEQNEAITTAKPQETGDVTEEFLSDNIPEDLKFNKVVTVLGCKQQAYHYRVEELSDNVVGNVIYNRNLTVEERLGIEIDWILEEGTFNERDAFIKKVEAQNQGGKPYDAAICYNLLPYAMAMKGLCANLNNTKYIDLSAPWWPQSYLETGIYKDQIFGLVESCSYGTLERMIATFFNENLLEDKQLEHPYDLVANNEWTYEKLTSMIKDTYEDKNTATSGKDAGDFFGFCAGGTQPMLDGWFFSLGNRYSQVNSDGELELLLGTPETEAYFEKFLGVFETDDAYLYDASHTVMFKEKRAIFYNTIVGMAGNLLDTDIEYGVVPTPKGSVDQEYYTHLGNTHEAWAIPRGVEDMDCSSALLECMASESYRQTDPVYFESQLKLRYAHDERIADMYDLIRDHIGFDFCYLYTVAFTNATQPNALIRKCVTKPAQNKWATVWGSNKTVFEQQFQTILDSYEN